MSLERFRRVFSIIPESEKQKPIAIIGDKAITWEQAYKEITEDTELGKKIQKRLEEENII